MNSKRQALAIFWLLAVCGSVWTAEATEPIAHWKFDEGSGTTAYDSAGDNDGDIINATWFDDPCRGMCLSFDGSSDFVLVGDESELEQQEITLSFWGQLDNLSGSTQGGIAKGYIFGNEYEFSYRMDFTGGYLRAGITNTANEAFGNFGYSIAIGDSGWHMWLMTVGGGTLTIYKDGTFVESHEYTGTIDYTKNHNNFVIGARDNGNYAFDGKIDDVRIYGTALSDEQIKELYLEEMSAYERAVINLEKAIDEKQEALIRIDVAIAKEEAAQNALLELLESGDYGDWDTCDIFKAKCNINSAIWYEQWCSSMMEKSIKQLEDALTSLGWEPNLIAHWKLDEGSGDTAYDSAGDNDGDIDGPTWTGGIIGGALEFDGDDDYVDCGTDSSLEPAVFTISAWVKPDTVSSDQHIAGKLGCEPVADCGYGYRLAIRSDGKASFHIDPWGCANGNPLRTTTLLEAERWYLVTGTYDGSIAKIYLNGVLENSGPRTLNSYYPNFYIGAYHSDYHNDFRHNFDGVIDDVRLYDRVLSAEEIRRIHFDGKCRRRCGGKH